MNVAYLAPLENVIWEGAMAEITTLFFSYAADRMSTRRRQFSVAPGTTIAAFYRQHLAEPLSEPIDTFLFSVNRQWADRERVLADGDELAVIPPVSGG